MRRGKAMQALLPGKVRHLLPPAGGGKREKRGAKAASQFKGEGGFGSFFFGFGGRVPALPAGHPPQELIFPPRIPGRRSRCRLEPAPLGRCGAAKRCKPSCPARLRCLLPPAGGGKREKRGGQKSPPNLKGRRLLAHSSSVFEEGVPALSVGRPPQELLSPHKFQGVDFAVGGRQRGPTGVVQQKHPGLLPGKAQTRRHLRREGKGEGLCEGGLQHKRPAAGLLPQPPPEGLSSHSSRQRAPSAPPPGRAPPLTTPYWGAPSPCRASTRTFRASRNRPARSLTTAPAACRIAVSASFFIKDVALIAGLSNFLADGV